MFVPLPTQESERVCKCLYLYQPRRVSVYVNVSLCFIEVHIPLPSQESERVCKCLYLYQARKVSVYVNVCTSTNLHTRSLSWLGRGICTSMKQTETFTYTLTFLAWLRYMYFYETKTNIYIHAHVPGLVEVYLLL
jgi:hypothetical protein